MAAYVENPPAFIPDINITLDTDIDLTGKDWTPIGTDYDNSYKGTFDGGGHTITGLTFTTNDEYAGLFGWLNRAGTVKNVVMEMCIRDRFEHCPAHRHYFSCLCEKVPCFLFNYLICCL